MSIESSGTELVERYLRARRLRYFRGRHDREFFVILTAGHDRLHVHLEIVPGSRDALTIRVTPGYFFPAIDRERLLGLARDWNGQSQGVEAVVHESSDPSRIGVVAENSYQIADDADVDDFADQTIRSAIKLFGELTPAAYLKDAG